MNAPPLSIGSLLAALSRALDLTEGQTMGHSVVACGIGLRIADVIGLSTTEKHDLQVALLLKDVGCSSNAARMYALFGGDELHAKRDSKFCNWCRLQESVRYALAHTAPHLLFTERLKKLVQLARLPGRVMDQLTQIRCERGAEIVRTLGFSEAVVEAVYHLDEHWDGLGAPHGKQRDTIPLLARIACLAQTVAVFFVHFGKEKALDVARERRRTWFDPVLVDALLSVRGDVQFWHELRTRPLAALDERTGTALRQSISTADLDAICHAFAGIVDAKSPFTADHSRRVAGYAVQIASTLALSPTERTELYRAGLLHDLGKLGVPNLVLEKPGRLTADEWALIRQHPESTAQILSGLPALERVRTIAAAHHEKLDGSGYWRGLSAAQLDRSQRVLAVADIWDALTADRPYRSGLTEADALAILQQESGTALDPECVAALAETPPHAPALAA